MFDRPSTSGTSPSRRRTVITVVVAGYLLLRALLLLRVDGLHRGVPLLLVGVGVGLGVTALARARQRRRIAAAAAELRADRRLELAIWSGGGVWSIRRPALFASAIRRGRSRNSATGVLVVDPGAVHWYPDAMSAARGVQSWSLTVDRVVALTLSRRVFRTWLHADVAGADPLEVAVLARSELRPLLVRAGFTVR